MKDKIIAALILAVMILFSVYSIATAQNPFEGKAAFECKRYDGREETIKYKTPLHIDQMNQFTESVVNNYLQSLDYESPLGIRINKVNLDKFINQNNPEKSVFLTWKKGSEKIKMLIIRNPNIEDTYLVYFKYKDAGVQTRYRK